LTIRFFTVPKFEAIRDDSGPNREPPDTYRADAALLKEVVFELASPELEGELTDQRAARLLLTME
jgi:hypothetical protein